MSKKIFYFMPVHWGWIKQRPHFLAEELSKFSTVDVYYPGTFRRIKKADNTVHGNKFKIKQIRKLPFSHWRAVRLINRLLFSVLFWQKIKRYQVLWLGHPALFDYFKWLPTKHLDIVYDCMDDVIEFPQVRSRPKYVRFLLSSESRLLEAAKQVLFSSETLKLRLLGRYQNVQGLAAKSLTINNAMPAGFESRFLTINEKKFEPDAVVRIGYFGTIAEWLDWRLIEESLKRFANIVYVFYGPVDSESRPIHERVIYAGIIEHEKIPDCLRDLSALVMPFINNQLIEAVDPVKLYEYSVSGLPALANAYPESEKFKATIYLYSNQEEYFDYLSKLTMGQLLAKADQAQAVQFAANNCWQARARLIQHLLKL